MSYFDRIFHRIHYNRLCNIFDRDFDYKKLVQKNDNYFVSPFEKSEILDVINDECPNYRRKILEYADAVLKHEINIVGKLIHFGNTINWHKDNESSYEWQLKFYKAISYRNSTNKGDIKMPWELSRFGHLVTLGQAYWFTADEKYTKEFIYQINDWIEKNPFGYGVNWSCTMEVAIRAINLILAFNYFKISKLFHHDFLHKFNKNMYLHGYHIFNNLEWNNGRTTNHFLSNIIGLLVLGMFFLPFKYSPKWLDYGIEALQKEMHKQVYSDGVDFEASTSYHCLVLELFIIGGLICRLNDIELEHAFWQRLRKMLNFTLHILKPNSKISQIGDNDNGRILGAWYREILDHTYLLSIGAVLFNDKNLKIKKSCDPEVLWLCGIKGYKRYKKLKIKNCKSLNSKAFQESGIFILRKRDDFIIVTAGPNGRYGNGGHCHNDKLSFELSVKSTDILIDPGTYNYTGNSKMRNTFRSTFYHNTILVDNMEQNRFNEMVLFKMAEDSQVKVKTWESTDKYDFFEAEHTGYLRLIDPVLHCRQIYFDKKRHFLGVSDILRCNSEHHFDQIFHFTQLNLKPYSYRRDRKIDECIKIFFKKIRYDMEEIKPGLGMKINLKNVTFVLLPLFADGLSKEQIEGWISPSYGIINKAPIVRYSKTATGATQFSTLLFWYENHN